MLWHSERHNLIQNMDLMCVCNFLLQVFQGLKSTTEERGAVDVGVASGEDPWRRWERAPSSCGGHRRPGYESRSILGSLFHQHCSGTLKYSPSPSDNCTDTMKEVRKEETMYSLNYYFCAYYLPTTHEALWKALGQGPKHPLKAVGCDCLEHLFCSQKEGNYGLWNPKPNALKAWYLRFGF